MAFVLTDLKKRGVTDLLIACIDELKGFPEAIEAVFPQTRVQLCIVVRSDSLHYVPDTNPIEGVYRQLGKITKSKGAFNSDQALLKLMYLIVKDISRKSTIPIHERV